MTPKTYLGDSVYAEINVYGQIVLTTENGEPDDPSNTIYLDSGVWASLVSFVGHAIATQAERQTAATKCPHCEDGITRVRGQDNEEHSEACPYCQPEPEGGP